MKALLATLNVETYVFDLASGANQNKVLRVLRREQMMTKR